MYPGLGTMKTRFAQKFEGPFESRQAHHNWASNVWLTKLRSHHHSSVVRQLEHLLRSFSFLPWVMYGGTLEYG